MEQKRDNESFGLNLDQFAKRQTSFRMNEVHDKITLEKIFENLARNAPKTLSRKKLHELTGGLLTEKTLANMDCEGTGIQPRFRMGGKIFYERDSAIAWLKSRCKIEGVV